MHQQEADEAMHEVVACGSIRMMSPSSEKKSPKAISRGIGAVPPGVRDERRSKDKDRSERLEEVDLSVGRRGRT